MTIVITGATGQLGRLVVEALLEHNVPPLRLLPTAGIWPGSATLPAGASRSGLSTTTTRIPCARPLPALTRCF